MLTVGLKGFMNFPVLEKFLYKNFLASRKNMYQNISKGIIAMLEYCSNAPLQTEDVTLALSKLI